MILLSYFQFHFQFKSSFLLYYKFMFMYNALPSIDSNVYLQLFYSASNSHNSYIQSYSTSKRLFHNKSPPFLPSLTFKYSTFEGTLLFWNFILFLNTYPIRNYSQFHLRNFKLSLYPIFYFYLLFLYLFDTIMVAEMMCN